MDLANKLFPYPIIGEGYDDYKSTTFESSATPSYCGHKINVKISMNVNNKEIKNLIFNDFISYVVHIECPNTCFREIISSKENNIEFEVDEGKVSGKVELSILLVAKKDIFNYRNYDLNDDYGETFFSFEKGNILGIGAQYKWDIDKSNEKLGKISSIFSVIMKKGKDKDFSIDIQGDKIKLLLCEEDYVNYKKIFRVKSYEGIIHSMFVLPALVYVFEQLKKSSIEDYEENRWINGIRKSIESYNIKFNDETIRTYESVKLAQMILDMPINRGLSILSKDEFEGEDE